MNIYETDKLLSEYLLFHYGTRSEIAPPAGAEHALDYARRCVSECVNFAALPAEARALDIGCAVGRSTFELARHCANAIGIDYSQRFIKAAETIRTRGEIPYLRTDEGKLTTQLIARRPGTFNRSGCRSKLETPFPCARSSARLMWYWQQI